MRRNHEDKDHKLVLTASQRLMYSCVDSPVWVVHANVHALASSVVVAATGLAGVALEVAA